MITNYITLVNHENKLVFSREDPHIRDRMEFLHYPHVVSVWLIVFFELTAISTYPGEKHGTKAEFTLL